MDLEFKEKIVHTIGFNEWNDFVNKYFDFKDNEYNLPYHEELNNDVIYEYTPDGNISRVCNEGKLKKLLNGDIPTYPTTLMFDYFVHNGILQKGRIYQIKISW